MTVTIDGFTIHNALWLGKKANLPSKRDMALVVWWSDLTRFLTRMQYAINYSSKKVPLFFKKTKQTKYLSQKQTNKIKWLLENRILILTPNQHAFFLMQEITWNWKGFFQHNIIKSKQKQAWIKSGTELWLWYFKKSKTEKEKKQNKTETDRWRIIFLCLCMLCINQILFWIILLASGLHAP